MPQEWDEKGNPIQTAQEWDENGKPITAAQVRWDDEELAKYEVKPGNKQDDDPWAKYQTQSPAIPGAPNGLPTVPKAIPTGLQGPDMQSGPVDPFSGLHISNPNETNPDYHTLARQNEIQNLSSVAHTGKPQPVAGLRDYLARVGGDTADVLSSVASPTSLGIAAANTNPVTGIPVDAALIGHGLFNTATNASEGLQGNPDALQKSLFGLSEAAGGAAGIGGQGPGARSMARRALLDPVTHEPTLTPSSMVKRVLRDPKDIPAAAPDVFPVSKSPGPYRGPASVPKQLIASPSPPNKMGQVAGPEGVKGSLPKQSGRLVLSPEELAAAEQIQKIAKKRASEHGMQYAAGMRPAGGGRVPR